ncbi:MAG TPA: hypothetical protein VK705_01415 [Ferruginibacter sp.]|jgi:hypothetical protein|nr:hypothetical protein [Ferruginibacter sp.]
MGKDKWVKTFLEMDIDKEPQYSIKVFKGNITDGNFVQNNEVGLLVDLYNLKTKIGYLGDSAQLHYLNTLTNLKPEMPFFSNESAHKKMAQAFFQNQIDYYEFIESYKRYLIEKIEAINPISKSIKEQSKSGIEVLDYLGYNSNIETIQNYNTRKDSQSFSSFQKRITELMEQFRIKTPLTKQETDSLNDSEIKEGYLMERNPHIPQNEEEAFELFKNYYAAIQCELQKHFFETNYKVWNKASIEAELKEIEDWIKKADKISYKDAVIGTNNVILNQQEGLYEYLRLKNGFYKGYLMTWEQHNNSSLSAMVYGRYFLFYEFLKEQIKNIVAQPIEAKQKNDGVMNKNSLSFFEDMVHQLYTYNYKIGAVNFFNYESFIEAKHGQIEFKGKVFYQNLIHAMPITGVRLADETKGEIPTYKERVFKDVLAYCSKKMNEIENKILPPRLFETNEKQNEGDIKVVTIFDKLSRELDIIENIFKAQHQKYDNVNPLPYPTILDNKGRGGVDGRYIASIDFFSNVELFNIQLYKSEFEKRFENSNDMTLVRNQLLELLDKALNIRDYYSRNFTNKNESVKEFLAKSKGISDKLFDVIEYHGAVINIYNYYIMEIYLGCNRSSESIPTRNYKFSYISDNNTLASICQSIIDFINRFNLDKANIIDYGPNISLVDPMCFVDPFILQSFLDAEKKALKSSDKFSNAIRCAAFCEILYEKKYIINTKTRRKTMNNFAKSKYGIDITIALSTKNSVPRERHKNKTVNNMPPLNRCF